MISMHREREAAQPKHERAVVMAHAEASQHRIYAARFRTTAAAEHGSPARIEVQPVASKHRILRWPSAYRRRARRRD